jgi:hypothetical protein
MAQHVIDQLEELCGRLREQLMQQPEYRALISLERTIQDLSACVASRAPEAPIFAPPAMEDERPVVDVHAMDAGISMRHGADTVADALADALRERKPAARPVDHLPSHRVA